MAYAKKTSKANEAFQKLKNDLAAGTDGNVFSTRIDQELILCCDDRAYRIDYVTDSLVRAPGAEQILGLCGRGG